MFRVWSWSSPLAPPKDEARHDEDGEAKGGAAPVQPKPARPPLSPLLRDLLSMSRDQLTDCYFKTQELDNTGLSVCLYHTRLVFGVG